MRTVIKILFCLTLISTEAVSQVVVANDKMNIVYAAVDNPISFAATGYKTENLVLVASCGELSRKEDFYNWTICGGDKFSKVIFSCYYTSRGIKRLIGTSEYRIKSVPDPQINFGIKEIEGSAHLSRETFLRVDIKGFDFVLKYRIKEFDIEFCRKNSDIIKIKNIGQQFSSDVISEIEKLEEGDCFCFKNFIVFNECEMIDRRLKDAECFKHIKTIPQPQW